MTRRTKYLNEYYIEQLLNNILPKTAHFQTMKYSWLSRSACIESHGEATFTTGLNDVQMKYLKEHGLIIKAVEGSMVDRWKFTETAKLLMKGTT